MQKLMQKLIQTKLRFIYVPRKGSEDFHFALFAELNTKYLNVTTSLLLRLETIFDLTILTE